MSEVKVDLDFKQALQAFFDSDVEGMREFTTELNKQLVNAFWDNKLGTIKGVLEQSKNFREQVDLEHEIVRSRDYYWGLIWGIENLTRSVLYRNEDFAKVAEQIKKHKHLNRILSYLKEKDAVQHKELATYLNISPSALTNFFVNNNIESFNVIYVDRIGKTKWYSLTGLGESYVSMQKDKENVEIDKIKSFIKQVVQAYKERSINQLSEEISQYSFMSEKEREELLSFVNEQIFEQILSVSKTLGEHRDKSMKRRELSEINLKDRSGKTCERSRSKPAA